MIRTLHVQPTKITIRRTESNANRTKKIQKKYSNTMFYLFYTFRKKKKHWSTLHVQLIHLGARCKLHAAYTDLIVTDAIYTNLRTKYWYMFLYSSHDAAEFLQVFPIAFFLLERCVEKRSKISWKMCAPMELFIPKRLMSHHLCSVSSEHCAQVIKLLNVVCIITVAHVPFDYSFGCFTRTLPLSNLASLSFTLFLSFPFSFSLSLSLTLCSPSSHVGQFHSLL